MAYRCIMCKKIVNKRQEAILCNGCNKWLHHSLNRRAAGRCGLPLYMYVALLHKETGLVSVQIRLVSECTL